MRVTSGDLREIVRVGPGWRPRPADAVVVTPAGIRTKAVAIYHEEGHSEALAYLAGNRPGARGLSGAFGPGGSRARQGARTRTAFDHYVRFDSEDGRPYAELTLAADVPVGTHAVGATVDVVVFDDAGYSGRLLNWDLEGIVDEVAELLAAPAVVLIEQGLGAATCVNVEVWDLEHGAKWLIDRDAALASLPEVARRLDQVANAITS